MEALITFNNIIEFTEQLSIYLQTTMLRVRDIKNNDNLEKLAKVINRQHTKKET